MHGDDNSQRIGDMLQLQMPQAGQEADFETRLAEEQGWTRGHAVAVTAEYRRFLALVRVTPHPVTPSRDVDAAWHLHMTRTRDYAAMCRERFGRFVHHEPSAGGTDELSRYTEQYAATLERYQEVFGSPPPSDIWPSTAERFSRLPIRSRSGLVLSTFWRQPITATMGTAGLALTLAVIWHSSMAGSPAADLRGAALLASYVVARVAVFMLQGWLRERATEGAAPVRLDAYELAWMAGGPARVTTAGICAAVAHGLLQLVPQRNDGGKLTGGHLARTDDAPHAGLHPVEVTASRGALGPVDLPELHARLASTSGAIEHRLRRAGLLEEVGFWPLAEVVPRVVSFAVLAWALAHLIQIASGPGSWGLLGLLVLQHLYALAARTTAEPRRSAQGRASLRDAVRGVPTKVPSDNNPSPAAWARTVALAAAVAGTSCVIEDERFAGINFTVGDTESQTGTSRGVAGCATSDDGGGGCGGCGGCG